MKANKQSLNKYTTFEALKQGVTVAALDVAERERLDAETKQMAELFSRFVAGNSIAVPTDRLPSKTYSLFAEVSRDAKSLLS